MENKVLTLTSKTSLQSLILIVLILLPTLISCNPSQDISNSIQLPEPRLTSNYSIEQALASRRSIRQYTDEPLTISEVSQLLWAAQGITLPERGYRTAPSAGARFPLHTYLIASNVTGLEAGFYSYHPDGHRLVKLSDEDKRKILSENGVRQSVFRNAPCSIVISGEFDLITERYGDRGIRYTHNEVGHASQNVHLQAEALGLGTVIIGSFDDNAVKEGLKLRDGVDPLYIMPVGRKP